MKIRTGFVSNSSSSSFCIVGSTFDLIDFASKVVPNKYKNKIKQYAEDYDYDEIISFLTEHEEELFPEPFDIFYAYDNDFCWFGINLENADENKSIKELKKELNDFCDKKGIKVEGSDVIVETISEY